MYLERDLEEMQTFVFWYPMIAGEYEAQSLADRWIIECQSNNTIYELEIKGLTRFPL